MLLFVSLGLLYVCAAADFLLLWLFGICSLGCSFWLMFLFPSVVLLCFVLFDCLRLMFGLLIVWFILFWLYSMFGDFRLVMVCLLWFWYCLLRWLLCC